MTKKHKTGGQIVISRFVETIFVTMDELIVIQGDLKRLDKVNYDKFKNQIIRNGFTAPFNIWIDPKKKKKVLDGTTRLATLKMMKAEKIQLPDKFPANVIMADNEKQAREILLGMSAEYGTMTDDGLSSFAIDSEIDMSYIDENIALPFNMGIDKLPDGSSKKEGKTDPDQVPEAPKKAKTKLGQVWILGEHRLICGDCTNHEVLEKLMDGKESDMVWTDPPYNVNYEGKTKEKLKIKNDKMDDKQFFQFLLDSFTNMAASTKKGGAIYVAHADSEGLNFRSALIGGGFLMKQCLIWVKQSIVMGRQDYHWKHEPILYGWRDGGSHSWFTDRKQSTVLEFDRPSRSEDHPTMKPVELVAYMIGNSSDQGQIVLDPFGGSGTTLIACEQLSRRAFLCELDPIYCDVIIRRWAEFTGETAKLA